MRNVIGIGLRGDTKSFVSAMDRATSKVITMHHRIDQGRRLFKKYGREISSTERSLESLQATIAKTQRAKARRQSQLTKDPIMAGLTDKLAADKLRLFESKQQLALERQMAAANQAAISKRFEMAGWASATAFVAGFASFAVADKIGEQLNQVVDRAADFQEQMSRVAFVSQLEVGSAGFKEIRGKALDVAMGSMFTPAEVGSAFYSLLTTGLTKAQATEALQPLTNLATIGKPEGMTMKEAADILGVGLQKMKIPEELKTTGERAQFVVDTFAKFTHVAPGGLKDIKSMLDSMGVSSKRLNMETSEQFAMLAMLRKSGFRAKRAGQKLSAMPEAIIKAMRDNMTEQAQLASKGQKIRRPAWEMLGVSKKDFVEASGDIKKEYLILFKLADKLTKVSKERGQAIGEAVLGKAFTNQTQTELLKLLATTDIQVGNKTLRGLEAFLHIVKELEKSKGTATKGAEMQLSTFRGAVDLLRGAFETIQVELGTPILEALTPILKQFKALTAAIAKFLRNNPAITKVISSFLVMALVMSIAAGAVFMLLGGILLVVAGLVMVAPFLAKIAVAAKFLIALLASTSVVGVNLSAVFIGIGASIDEASEKVNTFIKGIGHLFEAISSFKRDGIEFSISEDLAGDLEKTGMLGTFKTIVKFVYRMGLATDAFFDTVSNGFELLKDSSSDLLEALGVAFKQTFGDDNLTGTEDSFVNVAVSFGQLANAMLIGFSLVADAITLVVKGYTLLESLIGSKAIKAGLVLLLGGLASVAFILTVISVALSAIMAIMIIIGALTVAVMVTPMVLLIYLAQKFVSVFSDGLEALSNSLAGMSTSLMSFISNLEVPTTFFRRTGETSIERNIRMREQGKANFLPAGSTGPVGTSQSPQFNNGAGTTNKTANVQNTIQQENSITVNGSLATDEDRNSFVQLVTLRLKDSLVSEAVSAFGGVTDTIFGDA